MKNLIAVLILTCLCFNLFAQNIPSYVPTNGLVGWYPFNGNANDESGNGNNGTVGNGISLTTDRNNLSDKAYSFNGNGNISLVNLPTSSNQNFTISSWIKTTNLTARIGIACWGMDMPWSSVYFFITNTGFLKFDFAYNGGPQSNISVADGLWHFVSVSNNNGLITLNVDGSQSGQPLQMYPNISGPNKAIGANIDNSGNNNFIGSLDDIAIYNRALTQEEITALYQGSSTNSNNSGSVGINTTTPHPSAALDITDTQRGLLIPRMTASQRNNIQNPAEGLMVFQTDDSTGFWFYSGQKWNTINSKGIKGDQGEQGQVGPQGNQGEQGIAGSQGQPGPQGIQGEQGIQGINGSNGYTTLVNCIAEPSGSNCINGGIRVEFGIDENRNSLLDSVEVNPTQTKYVCNGAVSQTGSSKNVRIGYGQSGSWTCPQGVNSITVELWGAGGGGQQSCSPGANGGSGGYIKQNYNVIPGNTYSLIVGAGGSTPDFRGDYVNCGSNANLGPGGAGGISSFDGELIAEGGLGGSNGVNGGNGAVINWQYSSNGTSGNVSYIPNSWVQNPPTGIAGGGAGSSFCGYSFIACSSTKGENGYCIITY